MSQDETSVAPHALFDRTTKGRVFDPIPVRIERGRIAFFAEVLGLTDPIHLDVEAARAQGHPDLVAPPSFYMVIEAAANDALKRQGLPSTLERIGCDFRYLLHGDERYEYHGPIFANDEVTLTTSVIDFDDKKGGAMELAMLSSVVAHPDRGVLIGATRTLLHRFGEAIEPRTER